MAGRYIQLVRDTGTELLGGDRLIYVDPVAGVPQILQVPHQEGHTVMDMYRGATEDATGTTGKERAEKFTAFVHENMRHDEKWFNQHGVQRLVTAIRRREGVCKEFAATLQLLFQIDGIPSKFVSGMQQNEGHAWVKVFFDDGIFLADSSHGVFAEYESASKRWDYKEGPINIIRKA